MTMTWIGKEISSLFKGGMFTETWIQSQGHCITHAIYPQCTVENPGACSHIKDKKLKDCVMINRRTINLKSIK